ncbi:alpha/beta hydrolase [Sphingobium sp.]|uniref:alpha/beta fold hydrolase n=1 Tax=Sphingobium sp. TaxID=1912891 RepID=UPI002CAED1D1|nr:alpha/beta hydrolase [Sphingobium sp.]HUD90309.1 alpha/beta hydrolase [Sphingobium sp.]
MNDAMASSGAYIPIRPSRTFGIPVRGVDYLVRQWGDDSSPPLLLLHGGRDNSATFQFLVDAFHHDCRIVAPDWRGHGGSGWTPGSYWLADFLLDLDVLVHECLADTPFPLLGHSMGGNIASLYSATRPERVTKLIMLDALGNTLERSPVRIADELSELLVRLSSPARFRTYRDIGAMADRLIEQNPRLDATRALFLAREAARSIDAGGYRWPHDPMFRASEPTIHTVAEWGQCWSRIEAPVLALLSSDPRPHAATGDDLQVHERLGYFRKLEIGRMGETSHNLHHDRPRPAARIIEAFLHDDGGFRSLLDTECTGLRPDNR